MNIGISALAASGVFSSGTLAAPAGMSKGGGGRHLLPVKFGLGGVPLGNEFEVVSDEDAYKTLEAAWNAGVRYYDVSPFGLGLGERRYGNFLHNKNRDDYVLSSKVGKLLKASPHNDAKSNFPFAPSPNNVVFDYTADGVCRSIEDSLQRMGISRLDIAFVHDISFDNKLLPTPWQEQFAIALKGAFPALSKMRDEGMIKGWGIGVNTPEPILRVMQESDPDVCLLASQYSLIEHANALNNVFPVARERNVKFVIGSSLNAGFHLRQPALQLWRDVLEHSPPVHREAREAARCGGAVRRRSANRCASVLCGAGRRRRIDRRRAYRGSSPCQCELYAGDDSA
jgi:D-threo-aldose 1-dehydrogenase